MPTALLAVVHSPTVSVQYVTTFSNLNSVRSIHQHSTRPSSYSRFEVAHRCFLCHFAAPSTVVSRLVIASSITADVGYGRLRGADSS